MHEEKARTCMQHARKNGENMLEYARNIRKYLHIFLNPIITSQYQRVNNVWIRYFNKKEKKKIFSKRLTFYFKVVKTRHFIFLLVGEVVFLWVFFIVFYVKNHQNMHEIWQNMHYMPKHDLEICICICTYAKSAP